MEKIILFEGKVTLAGKLVDFRIYKNEEDGFMYYSYEVNPEVKDVNQADYHRGETLRANTIEDLFFRFKQFQGEFKEINGMRFNELF